MYFVKGAKVSNPMYGFTVMMSVSKSPVKCALAYASWVAAMSPRFMSLMQIKPDSFTAFRVSA